MIDHVPPFPDRIPAPPAFVSFDYYSTARREWQQFRATQTWVLDQVLRRARHMARLYPDTNFKLKISLDEHRWLGAYEAPPGVEPRTGYFSPARRLILEGGRTVGLIVKR